MKNLIFYLFAVALTLSSCQTEDTLLTPENKDQSLQLDAQETGQNGLFGNTNRKGGDPLNYQVLENRLHWFSFITAKLLRHDAKYQAQFVTLLGAGSTIPASDIIGDGPFTSNFYNDFRVELINYINGVVPDPDDEPAKPPKPPLDLPGGFGPTPEMIADEIIDYLTNIHCVELYFPKGLDLVSTEPESITSTAHPLTGSMENEGYKRLYVGILDPDTSLVVVTFDATVNAAYLNDPLHTVVIVARPNRTAVTPEGPDCSYAQYSEIDFEDFLENIITP